MSGSDGRRQSVWSMLDAIQPPSPRDVESIDGSAGYAGSDRSSIMMYSPLIPSADSVIELAELEDVPVVQGAPSSGWWFTWPTWPYIWPFNGWTAKVGVDATSGSSTSQPQPHINTVQEAPVQRQRVWVPSRTQLSFETMWWGYRIYLPPPVLAILDDQSVEAAKQATTVSVALTWFFTNLPISTFPPPVQPAMILLQRLVPFVSYIGTFISWSWSTIRGFDRGHGVILTATWLLPIALIPGTWHARDVPPPPSPAPAPVLELVVPPPPPVPEPLIVELAPSIPAVVRLPPASGDEGPVAGPSRKQRKPSTVEKARTKTTSTLRKLTRTRT
ncbi:hypothetical protein DFH07DRAFT_730618 [Mycena maculata]|uniref:Uncharacterized protein n=1 Tax=Mycena maculata TaxID=230809 RepID=A0AAD7K5A2_9AGAR|nr:hypothetical protein DFH07DRAFT_730618 [Mycena maculata]